MFFVYLRGCVESFWNVAERRAHFLMRTQVLRQNKQSKVCLMFKNQVQITIRNSISKSGNFNFSRKCFKIGQYITNNRLIRHIYEIDLVRFYFSVIHWEPRSRQSQKSKIIYLVAFIREFIAQQLKQDGHGAQRGAMPPLERLRVDIISIISRNARRIGLFWCPSRLFRRQSCDENDSCSQVDKRKFSWNLLDIEMTPLYISSFWHFFLLFLNWIDLNCLHFVNKRPVPF